MIKASLGWLAGARSLAGIPLPGADAWSIPCPIHSLRSRVGEDKPSCIAGFVGTVLRDINQPT